MIWEDEQRETPVSLKSCKPVKVAGVPVAGVPQDLSLPEVVSWDMSGNCTIKKLNASDYEQSGDCE